MIQALTTDRLFSFVRSGARASLAQLSISMPWLGGLDVSSLASNLKAAVREHKTPSGIITGTLQGYMMGLVPSPFAGVKLALEVISLVG